MRFQESQHKITSEKQKFNILNPKLLSKSNQAPDGTCSLKHEDNATSLPRLFLTLVQILI